MCRTEDADAATREDEIESAHVLSDLGYAYGMHSRRDAGLAMLKQAVRLFEARDMARETGTARNRLDYAWLPTWATIPAGEASATIDVAPVADWYAESPETVVVTLLPNTAYAVSSSLPAATVTIADEP